ncbi:hypothetical protein X738_02405 [Mesorhizobium sp. LNHC209A00]|nr:hypothetical protein X738_02405 [Mesorhizobium sp. LNHC209A00]
MGFLDLVSTAVSCRSQNRGEPLIVQTPDRDISLPSRPPVSRLKMITFLSSVTNLDGAATIVGEAG